MVERFLAGINRRAGSNERRPGTGKPATLYLFSDGGTRVFPPAASSAVVVKNKEGQVLDWQSRLLPAMTNCEAEYNGLLDAIELAQHYQPSKTIFHLDNQTVVGQVTGYFAVRDPKLKPLFDRAAYALAELKASGCREIQLLFIPREFNLLADALASDALLVMPDVRAKQPARLKTDREAKA